MADRVDPQFPRYHLSETTIDGPRKTDGEIVFTLHCRAVVVPDDAQLAAGEPIQLRVFDFAGPKVEHNPGPIPQELLDACAAHVSELIASHARDALEEPTAQELAAAVLEEIGRRLRPNDHEAVSLAMGVQDLSMVKVCAAGDELEQASLAFPYAPAVIAARKRWREVRGLYGRPKVT